MQIALECKQCGGQLEGDPAAQKTIKCKYCDSVNVFYFSDNINLYNRANYLRRNNEFDRAISIYEDIIKTAPTDADAYYGIALCKYGIEYVDDPNGNGKIPTCHRTRYIPMSQDTDFQKALEYADEETREVYLAEAERIDQIQKQILALSSKEEKYDIFICYKESDENGERTQASVLAQDIYQELTRTGDKVFFARKTLEQKLGSEYEPIIFAALYSAKVMLVIGTNPEQYQAVWVKNEWSRFRERLAAREDCTLIPLYQNMSPYELPQEFSNLQALDISKIGFLQDLQDGIAKLLRRNINQQSAPSGATGNANNTNDVTNLLKRAALFMEQRDFASAAKYYERILDSDAECAEAYLGKLMISRNVVEESDLQVGLNSLQSDNNYQLALRFADEDLKRRLVSYEEQIQINIEVDRQEQEQLRFQQEQQRLHQLEIERQQKEQKKQLQLQKKRKKRNFVLKLFGVPIILIIVPIILYNGSKQTLLSSGIYSPVFTVDNNIYVCIDYYLHIKVPIHSFNRVIKKEKNYFSKIKPVEYILEDDYYFFITKNGSVDVAYIGNEKKIAYGHDHTDNDLYEDLYRINAIRTWGKGLKNIQKLYLLHSNFLIAIDKKGTIHCYEIPSLSYESNWLGECENFVREKNYTDYKELKSWKNITELKTFDRNLWGMTSSNEVMKIDISPWEVSSCASSEHRNDDERIKITTDNWYIISSDDNLRISQPVEYIPSK